MYKGAIAQIICWKCRQYSGRNFNLLNVRLETVNRKTKKLRKSNDYICNQCHSQGYYAPEIWNTSRWVYPTKEELEKMFKQMQESANAAAPEHKEGDAGQAIEP